MWLSHHLRHMAVKQAVLAPSDPHQVFVRNRNYLELELAQMQTLQLSSKDMVGRPERQVLQTTSENSDGEKLEPRNSDSFRVEEPKCEVCNEAVVKVARSWASQRRPWVTSSMHSSEIV